MTEVNSTDIKYLPKARSGREKQVYNDVGAREVAGCVPVDFKTGKVLLISSRRRKDCWVFPKGGWENDETIINAAMRETWEEAGVKGEITKLLGKFKQYKKLKKHPKVNVNTAEITADGKKYLHSEILLYEMNVTEIAEDWPEKDERERLWVNYEDAKALVKKTAYVDEALELCSLAH